MSTAKPRYETKPTPRAKTWQSSLLASGERLGTPMMPWQKKAGRLLTELGSELCSCHVPPQPLPRFKTVAVSVPRQQGKTVLSRAAMTTKAESENRLDLYGTAQSRQYAAKHVLSLGDALQLAGSKVKVLRGVGAESVTWSNGSTYLPISPTDGGGHGDSIDFMLIDEGWALEAHVMGGVRPAMIARPHSQLLIISTMGTVESEVWNRIVARGRESVDDPDATMAYLEYSAERDEDTFDESKWASWMPALGITVSPDDIRTAIEDVEPNEAIRAFGNRTVKTMVSIFPADWVEKAWAVIQPPERMVLSVDVNEEPAGASVSSGHISSEGEAGLRLLRWQAGSARWVPDFVDRVIQERTVEAVVADFGGPSREIRAELERVCGDSYVPLVDRMPRDLAADTARFYDSLRNGTVHMEKSEPLLESIQGAVRKQLGDLWVVTRRQMVADASPVISVILAHGMASELDLKPVVDFFIL